MGNSNISQIYSRVEFYFKMGLLSTFLSCEISLLFVAKGEDVLQRA